MGKIISTLLAGFFLLGVLSSCAPRQVAPMNLTEVKFEKTPKLELNLDDIPDPGKPNMVYISEDGKVVDDPSKAKYVAFTKEEFAKVVANLKLKNTYKELYITNVELANQYIDTLNHLKDLVEKDQQLIQLLNERQAYFENQYRQEAHDHRVNNIYHRSVIGLMGIGAVIIAILAL